MNTHVQTLKEMASTFTEVLAEVTRLEAVNQQLYEINNKKVEENLELTKTLEGQKETIEVLIRIKNRMKDSIETIIEDVLTSDNLLTLKTDMDLYRERLNSTSELERALDGNPVNT